MPVESHVGQGPSLLHCRLELVQDVAVGVEQEDWGVAPLTEFPYLCGADAFLAPVRAFDDGVEVAANLFKRQLQKDGQLSWNAQVVHVRLEGLVQNFVTGKDLERDVADLCKALVQHGLRPGLHR